MTTHKVMLVEDRPQDMRLTVRALKKAGYDVDVVMASHGKEAVDMLDAGSNPDLILLDWRLPIMSGEEVLKYVRSKENMNIIPVIVLTTSSDSEDVDVAYRSGCNAYLTKPVNTTEFDDTIEALGLFWLKKVILPKR